MKKCIILPALISMYALTAQTGVPFSQCLRAGAQLGYTLTQQENTFSDLSNATGFGLGMDYCIGGKHLKFVASPYIFLWQGKSLTDMKAYYKERDFTLNNYNSGTYYTSGVLMGLHYTFKRAVPDKFPVFYTALQYGFVSANLPATEAQYDEVAQEGVVQRTDAAKGLGTALQLSLGAEVLKAGNTTYYAGLNFRREAADIPYLATSNVNTPATQLFLWRTQTIQLQIGATFSIE